mgnify:CR=1 FL=1
MNNALRTNELKKGHFIKNILAECQQGTDFRIICFDIDNVIINEKTLKEEQIKLIEERATSEYHDHMIKDKTAEDRKEILVGNNEYELADHIITLLTDNEKADNMAQNGYDFVHRVYDWEKATKIMELGMNNELIVSS